MFKFNNTHIFTGYLKQKLSSVNIPTCKIYTREFAEYAAKYKKEDPRIIESIGTVDYRQRADDGNIRLATTVNYLKNNELYNYFWKYEDYDNKTDLGHSETTWRPSASLFYDSEKSIPGLTKTLHSPGCYYDKNTHEYLGEYLRFLRDYHDINLMSLYNCFNDSICNNIFLDIPLNPADSKDMQKRIVFNSQDANYKIYAIPVKLFADYTIAIDSYQGIEMFCGLYRSNLDGSTAKASELIRRTYKKADTAIFKQPFLYDKLNVKYWDYKREIHTVREKDRINNKTISRWDIANREQDLRLFIKIPASCKSSIVILEGDFRNFNNTRYAPITIDTLAADGTTITNKVWSYKQNHAVLNFNTKGDFNKNAVDLNKTTFKPISKLQLLEFNTGESYPFADRLVEYLSGSAITPIDEIPDNIKRTQRVMKQNQYHFKIEGLWENKMQKILYDYIINSGPIIIGSDGKLEDMRQGYYSRLGHTTKSTLYDVLGYVDRDLEKWYASWKKQNNKVIVRDSIQNIDIYDGLYDI